MEIMSVSFGEATLSVTAPSSATGELKTCAKRKDVHRGIQLHNDILRSGSLDRNSYLASSLISMYAKCGLLAKAQNVLDGMSVRNVVSWNALIAGYVQQGKGFVALNCFKQMKIEGVSPDVTTFVCILKASVLIGSIEDCKQIHDEILSRGLVQKDIVLGTALVDMYAKCGMLRKAYQLLEELADRDVVCWNALITGYAQEGQGHEVLNCFEQMQREGLCPDVVTFICILKACGCIGAIEKGSQIHQQVEISGFLQKDIALGTSLVDMYAKCGVLDKAQQVLDDIPVRTVVCWNALITGYCDVGQVYSVLNCVRTMENEGILPDLVTFLSILKACGSTKSISKGKQIHIVIISRGLLNNDIVLGNALVNMYAKCGMVIKAQHLADELSLDNVVSFNTILTGLTAYAQQGEGHEALTCLEQMQRKGHTPNVVTFICLLKACGHINAIGKGRQIHNEILVRGLLEKDIALGNALVDMYVKCGALLKAQQVFEEIPVRDVVSWNVLIGGYIEEDKRHNALMCFEWMQIEGCVPDSVTFLCVLKACGSARAIDEGMRTHGKVMSCCLLEKDIKLGTALIEMYSKCGMLSEAEKVLKGLSVRDEVSWNALIAGYVEHGCAYQAFDFFEQMKSEGVSPDAFTFISMLTACGSTGAVEKAEEIHKEIVRRGLKKDTVLGSALVDFYAKLGLVGKAHQILEELPNRSAVSWSALIAGYAQNGQAHGALNCFEQMKTEGFSPDVVVLACILKCCANIRAVEMGKRIHGEIVSDGLLGGKGIMLGTALIDMYAKFGFLRKAKEILEELPVRDVVAWNALIGGYAQQGQSGEALDCCEKMESDGILPNSTTFIFLSMACGGITAVNKGRLIHEKVMKRGLLEKDIMLGVSLISMYANCGAVEKAHELLLLDLPFRNVTCWNALIGGCAKCGLAHEALKCFEKMQNEGIHPDEITLLCVINACNHSGLLDEAQTFFDNISRDYGITPKLEHYTCMVMVFGCAGQFGRAMSVIESMPSFYDRIAVWLVLLGACRMWGNVKLGRLVFDQVFQLVDNNCAQG